MACYAMKGLKDSEKALLCTMIRAEAMPLSIVLKRHPAFDLATEAFRLHTSLLLIMCQMTGGHIHLSSFQAFISLPVKHTQPGGLISILDHNKQGAQPAKSLCSTSTSSFTRGTQCCMSMQFTAYRVHEPQLQLALILSSTSGVYPVLAALVPHSGVKCVHKDSSGHASALCFHGVMHHSSYSWRQPAVTRSVGVHCHCDAC